MLKLGTEIRVRVTTIERMLGTANTNPDIHSRYIASLAPDAASKQEEVEALGAEEVEREGMTVFPRNADGIPIIWNYQVEGFFKGACGFLRNIKGTKSANVKAYKKKIDGLVKVQQRQIPINTDQPIGNEQRPLRAQTAQGERVALANSEAIEPGATMEFSVLCLDSSSEDLVREWLDYGMYNGFLQWRNSGKGRFIWQELNSAGNVIGGNYDEFVSNPDNREYCTWQW